MYARMIAIKKGIDVDRLFIIATIRDWARSKSLREENYPGKVVSIEFQKWSNPKVDEFFVNKIDNILLAKDLADDDLPLCTPEERWLRGECWAVMKTGRKSAVKRHYTLVDAEQHLATLDNKHSIEHRKGENMRCKEYCECNTKCNFYLNEVENGQ